MINCDDDRRYISRQRLVELLGVDPAARVLRVFGGKRIYVPAPETESYGHFADRLGDQETARKLCVEFGGTQIVLPQRVVPMNEEILKLNRESLRPTEIAQRLGCTESYVYYVLREERRAL